MRSRDVAGMWSSDVTRHRFVAVLVLLMFVVAGVAADLSDHGAGDAFLAAHNPKARGLRGLAPRVPEKPRKRVGPEERAVNRVLGRVPYVSSGGPRHRLVAL